MPFKHRPDFLRARLRSLGMLVFLGGLVCASTLAAGFVGSASRPALALVGGLVVAFAFNLVLFTAAFKWLTATELAWREVLPGVIAASVLWQLLQSLGGYYIEHVLRRTEPLYGVFAAVLGLLAWLYLGAQVMLFAAEINVVRLRRLWPRSLSSGPILDSDRRALTGSAKVEERVHEENVEVDFDSRRMP